MTSEPSASLDPIPADLRDYVLFDLSRPAGLRVFTSDRLGLDLICLEPGQTMPPRTFTASDAVYTVLGGQAWLVTDEAAVTLGPLQAVFVPAGVPHGLRNESADPLILQVVGAPPPALDPAVTPSSEAFQASAEAGPAGQHRLGLLDRLRRVLGG